MGAEIGTLEWAARTNGRLSAGDQVRLLAQGIGAQLADWRSGLAHRLGLAKGGELALREVPIPDGAIVDRITAAAREVSEPWVISHNLRSYLWGGLLAVRDGRKYDPLLFYSACLLHDLGLTNTHWPAPGDCFAVHGSRVAEGVALSAGLSADQARAVSEAISLHLNVTVPESSGAEAVLLSAGTGFDTIGRRAREIPVPLRDEVIARHPRLHLKQELCAVIGAQAKQSPATRTGFLCSRVQFLSRVRHAPFLE